MGDLISRSALIEALEKHYNSLTYENVPTSIADFYCEMEKLFKEQPTAYNVEKVVAELEERKEDIAPYIDDDIFLGEYRTYKEILEIVKQ